MADSFAIFVEGLTDIDLSTMDRDIELAAQRAINKTADRTRKQAADEMRHQVHFPAAYLSGPKSRLRVTQKASAAALEAVITGRSRPTSLARFVVGTPTRDGLTVMVKPGRSHEIKKGFLIRLRSGDEGALGNMGLAVRTPNGRAPRGAWRPTKLAPNLWLLYGPSVDQVFKGVREDVAPGASEYLAAEFTRLLDLNI